MLGFEYFFNLKFSDPNFCSKLQMQFKYKLEIIKMLVYVLAVQSAM